MLERTKHAELLLEYGALPDSRNEHGQRPVDLIPRDAVRSTKLYFKRIFDVSYNLQITIYIFYIFCILVYIHTFDLIYSAYHV